jgi:hypothetical protein
VGCTGVESIESDVAKSSENVRECLQTAGKE